MGTCENAYTVAGLIGVAPPEPAGGRDLAILLVGLAVGPCTRPA